MAKDSDATIQAITIRPKPDRIPEKKAHNGLGSDSFMAVLQDSIGLLQRKGVSFDRCPRVDDDPTRDDQKA